MTLLQRQILLGILTLVIAAAILTPTFLVLNALMDAGLEVAFVAVVVSGIVLAVLLHAQTYNG